MEIRLTHPFVHHCHDIVGLLEGVNTVPEFCKRLNAQSILHVDRYTEKKYKGDGFETLGQAMCLLSPIDNRIGISDYKLVSKDDDYGVDGVGIGTNGRPMTVQLKYKSNPTSYIMFNDDHIGNFINLSTRKYCVDMMDTKNMLIITTARGLHHSIDDNDNILNADGEVCLRCIGYEDLCNMLDNNHNFWNLFRMLVTEALG